MSLLSDKHSLCRKNLWFIYAYRDKLSTSSIGGRGKSIASQTLSINGFPFHLVPIFHLVTFIEVFICAAVVKCRIRTTLDKGVRPGLWQYPKSPGKVNIAIPGAQKQPPPTLSNPQLTAGLQLRMSS